MLLIDGRHHDLWLNHRRGQAGGSLYRCQRLFGLFALHERKSVVQVALRTARRRIDGERKLSLRLGRVLLDQGDRSQDMMCERGGGGGGLQSERMRGILFRLSEFALLMVEGSDLHIDQGVFSVESDDTKHGRFGLLLVAARLIQKGQATVHFNQITRGKMRLDAEFQELFISGNGLIPVMRLIERHRARILLRRFPDFRRHRRRGGLTGLTAGRKIDLSRQRSRQT